MTQGLVLADQHFMFTICPPDGGAFITAPTEETIYTTIIRGATGNGTLVSFEPWQISDIFRGCGKFEKYSLSGDAAALAKLQYPEPGKTLADCPDSWSCNKIKLLDTNSNIRLDFNLNFHPAYGQAVKTVPFRIDISACSPATLNVSQIPEPLVLNRNSVTGNKVHIDFETRYKPLFVSSMPNGCPVTMFQLFTSRGEEHRSMYI